MLFRSDIKDTYSNKFAISFDSVDSDTFISNERLKITAHKNVDMSGLNQVFGIDTIKSNSLEQIKEEGYPMFCTEDYSNDSLNDDDYEYTQLNTSTLKELSDLDKDSGSKDKIRRNHIEEGINCIRDSVLFCTENINDFLQTGQ